MALTACGETIDMAAFENPDQCRADGVYTAEFCEQEHQKALKLHRDVAPRYATREDCEAGFGPTEQCEPAATGGAAHGGVVSSGGRYYNADGTPYTGLY